MAGYTRQDTANNIANGNVIDADDFDAEYNALEAAFNATTGHKHDGTSPCSSIISLARSHGREGGVPGSRPFKTHLSGEQVMI